MRRFGQWIRCVLTCGLAAAMALGGYDLKTSAQASPSSLPLLSAGSVSYVGGFRVPAHVMDRADFSYGGKPVAFNPANNSLFVGAGDGKVAEISIPVPVNSGDVEAMPFASYLQQAFVDPTEGHLRAVSSSDVTLDGLLVYGNRLYGSASTYYDANNTQRVSHFSRSLHLTQPSFSGWSQVWEQGRSGFVSGMMATVPAEWQTLLGGPALTGQCCIPIVYRTSLGPAAFAFNPAQVGQPTVSATPLLYYPSEHPTLGEWAASNGIYGSTTRINGIAIIAGTRTALFIGSNGIGPYCYGDGTADRAAADASGGYLCYDPIYASKGPHGFPYNYQVWAYDLNDFVAVKAGTTQPWDVKPYHVWPLSFPTDAPTFLIGGVGYDAQRQTLYISQRDADGFYARRPIMHAFKLNATPGAAAPTTNLVSNVTVTADKTAPRAQGTAVAFTAQASGGVAPGASVPPAASSVPAPGPLSRVTGVSLSANQWQPQAVGTSITWTAVPSGGTAPFLYKWLVFYQSGWTIAADWSSSNTFTWTPAVANNRYRVQVWVKSASNPADRPEKSTNSGFSIK